MVLDMHVDLVLVVLRVQLRRRQLGGQSLRCMVDTQTLVISKSAARALLLAACARAFLPCVCRTCRLDFVSPLHAGQVPTVMYIVVSGSMASPAVHELHTSPAGHGGQVSAADGRGGTACPAHSMHQDSAFGSSCARSRTGTGVSMTRMAAPGAKAHLKQLRQVRLLVRAQVVLRCRHGADGRARRAGRATSLCRGEEEASRRRVSTWRARAHSPRVHAASRHAPRCRRRTVFSSLCVICWLSCVRRRERVRTEVRLAAGRRQRVAQPATPPHVPARRMSTPPCGTAQVREPART
jgi:hypothetical protein